VKIKRWIIRNPDNSASLDSPKRNRPENPFGRNACHITIILFPGGIIYAVKALPAGMFHRPLPGKSGQMRGKWLQMKKIVK
jgi:hypothetical protein